MSDNALIILTAEQVRELVMDCIREALRKTEPTGGDERYFTRREACEKLHISLPTLNRYVKLNIVKGNRVGTRILFTSDDISSALHEIPTRKYK